ncbi:MAG TPA: anti-sigma factor [Streptosporangiaceae bacterium]
MKFLRPDLHTLTGAYALDAIDDGERDRFEHHLRRCQSCEHEVRGMQETAARLGAAVSRQPPPGLKAAVLTAAASTWQHPPVVDPPLARAPQARRRPRLAVTVAALATVIALALAVTVGVQRHQLDQVQSRQRTELAQFRAQLARIRAQQRNQVALASAQQRAVAAVLAAPGARIVTGRTSLGGTATMVVARRPHKMIFVTRGLPVLTDARVYELWVIRPDGTAIRAGLLPPASDGRTAPVLATAPSRRDLVGLTVEPAGGTKKPTTTPIVALPAPA